jgi:putative membrane protein
MGGHLRAEHFFTKEEKERIKNATKEAETRSIGEVVVMVVDRSDDYFDGEVIGGVVGGSLLSLAITALFFNASMWFFIPLAFVFFFPFRIIFKKYHPLRTAFLGVKRREHAVRHRAIRAFHEKGLTRTKEQTGVLFFISLLERKVWVLADKGIHRKIGQDTLNAFAAKVSQGIAEGNACDALCETIKEAGELLAQHFPKTIDDTDELTDDVMAD